MLLVFSAESGYGEVVPALDLQEPGVEQPDAGAPAEGAAGVSETDEVTPTEGESRDAQ